MIYITGDIHGDISRFQYSSFPEQEEMTKQDYVIVLGDFGLPWMQTRSEKKMLYQLNHKPFTILFIDGNHENQPLLNSFPVEEWNGGKVSYITENIIYLRRGQVFNIEGLKFFTFGGASSIDKEYRTDGIDWFKEEIPNLEEMNEGLYNLQEHGNSVDYVLTHTCPCETYDELKSRMFLMEFEYDEVNKYLSDVDWFLIDDSSLNEHKYKKWFFGHFHSNINLMDDKVLLFDQFVRVI